MPKTKSSITDVFLYAHNKEATLGLINLQRFKCKHHSLHDLVTQFIDSRSYKSVSNYEDIRNLADSLARQAQRVDAMAKALAQPKKK